MRFTFLLLISVVVLANSPALAEPPAARSWSIAIHGGASDPTDWNAERQAGRREGLTIALTKGKTMLAQGRAAIDVVEAVIKTLEDDPKFNAGRGAVLTTAGRAELDASIMDGRTRACGAVAGVTTIKNPIELARLVMSQTKHVLLAGDGAEQFGVSQNVTQVKPDYFLSDSNQLKNAAGYLGTVGCVVLDTHGNLAAGTSTGGTTKKLPGRIGDSPIVGAGTYASNDTCAVSGTGVGEEYIRNAVAYDVAAQMKYAGKSLQEAVDRIMNGTLEDNVGGIISVSSEGDIVLQHNTRGMSCGAAHSNGRFDVFLQLPNDRFVIENRITDIEQVRQLLNDQVAAWNTGDIDEFMTAYWNSERLTFTAAGNVTRGYQATLDRYKERYPNRETMGKLTFRELELFQFAASGMQVHGIWELQRKEATGGRFTIVLQKFDDGWKIVHDHTSVRQ